jgi:hypothetical protein
MITALQKYACTQTELKVKMKTVLLGYWPCGWTFAWFPFFWLYFYEVKKSQGVYATAQLTFKDWTKNLGNQYGIFWHTTRASILSLMVPPATSNHSKKAEGGRSGLRRQQPLQSYRIKLQDCGDRMRLSSSSTPKPWSILTTAVSNSKASPFSGK